MILVDANLLIYAHVTSFRQHRPPAIGLTELLGALLCLPGVHANLVPDAHLAALAIEHGFTLCSTDGDLARFPGLAWLNPLV